MKGDIGMLSFEKQAMREALNPFLGVLEPSVVTLLSQEEMEVFLGSEGLRGLDDVMNTCPELREFLTSQDLVIRLIEVDFPPRASDEDAFVE